MNVWAHFWRLCPSRRTSCTFADVPDARTCKYMRIRHDNINYIRFCARVRILCTIGACSVIIRKTQHSRTNLYYYNIIRTCFIYLLLFLPTRKRVLYVQRSPAADVTEGKSNKKAKTTFALLPPACCCRFDAPRTHIIIIIYCNLL